MTIQFFGGRPYKHTITKATKKEAVAYAQNVRAKGKLARIVKCAKAGYGTFYQIWVH